MTERTLGAWVRRHRWFLFVCAVAVAVVLECFGIAGITDRVREAFSLTEMVSVADQVTPKD